MRLAEGATTVLGLDLSTWLGVLALVVAITLPIWIYLRQKTPKTLDYAVVDTQDLTPPGGDTFPRLCVTWITETIIRPPGPDDDQLEMAEDHYLDAPRIARVQLKNTGKRAILAEDFKDPVTVAVATGEIIDVAVIETSHPGIHELASR